MDGHSSSRCRRASAPTAGCMVHRSHQSFLKDPFIFPKDSHAPTLEFSTMCLLIKSCQCTHSHSLVHAYRFCRLTQTHTRKLHAEKSAFQGKTLLCEARGSVTDPSVQNKDLSSAVILSLQTGGDFAWGSLKPGFEVVIYLFHLLSRAREA